MKFYPCMRVMKITMMLLASLLVQIKAATYAQRITLSKQNSSIHTILEEVRKQSRYDFFYDMNLFDKARPVNIKVRNATVEQVLNACFRGQPYSYVIRNKLVMISQAETVVPAGPAPQATSPSTARLQQHGRISGKVMDNKGEPLPGASVRIIQTRQAVQSGVDGSYNFSIAPGSYTVEVSYISFQTKRVTQVEVKAGQATSLNIVLQPATSELEQVVVTGSFRKESIASLYAQQKNAAGVTNGISAEQISRTPDKNIGESLKRISGVTTFDNKYIVVRGIGERYNAAMLDGTLLPSTDAQSRNFSFDLIPSNLVDNVVVSKTVTPDMNGSFGGGLVQVNTRDIPNENFMSFTAGATFNDQTTGKDFLSHKRGKYDYLGFDDGRRKFPEGLMLTTVSDPERGLVQAAPELILAQSKKFTTDNFSVYRNIAAPSQNYQLSLGRVYDLKKENSRFGFTGSLSYRNTQSISLIEGQTRGSWAQQGNNHGKDYGFNTTWGALLNAGLELGKHRFSFRNTYTHLYDNTFTNITGWSAYREPGDAEPVPSRIEEADAPTFTNLLQNKLSGQHQMGKYKLEWDVARTSVFRNERDMGVADKASTKVGADYLYVYGQANQNGFPMSRHNYENSESHYSWQASASRPFNLGIVRSTAKAGYFGISKHGEFDWVIAILAGNVGFRPVSEALDPANMSMDGNYYTIDPYRMDSYEGKSRNHAGYLMLDHRVGNKLRLVWGLRGEYYKYTEVRNNPSSAIVAGTYSIKPDKRWQWLPSANLTYSPLSSLNLRAAYSSSMVRPELMENTQFMRYKPSLGSLMGNQGIYSTRIDSYDLRAEWFPGTGEIISAGAFYKRFDKPAELDKVFQSTHIGYYLKSSDWARVYGLEFELRKNFGFIGGHPIFEDLAAYGNLTFQTSDVKAYYMAKNPDDLNAPDLLLPTTQSRPMYGQTPYLINVGLQYAGERLGLNLAYNKSSYKTYTVSGDLSLIEYEAPRAQIDAQISYRFFNKRLEWKINAGNLLNQASMFYQNEFGVSYEQNPDYVANEDDISEAARLRKGFTEKYEQGDRVLYKQRYGRSYSTSFTWNF